MHRRDLERCDIHVAHELAATDRIARGVHDDPGDHGNASLHRLDRRGHQVAIFLVIERVALAGRAAGRDAMRAGADHPVDLGRHEPKVDLAVLPERRRHRRDHAGRSCLHGLPSRFLWSCGGPALLTSIRPLSSLSAAQAL
ncbi:hypothetical protein ACVWXN_002623 [Bradyrhizobium sp. i1.4.4]